MKKIVTILSTNYAGSHYLAGLLGGHSETLDIGEIRHLFGSGARPQKIICQICDIQEECPLKRGLNDGNIEQVYDIILSNFESETISTIIDNSKRVDWARNFLDNKKYDFRYIHLIRDPRALVRRWLLVENVNRIIRRHRIRAIRNQPSRIFSLLGAEKHEILLLRWLRQNQGITSFIKQYNLNARIITYHDLATSTEAVLADVMSWLDMDLEMSQFDYWKEKSHGPENKAKSRQADTGKGAGRYFDLRWKEYLSEAMINELTCNPLLEEYLKELSVRITDEGLVGI
jgi:hypothetical protein